MIYERIENFKKYKKGLFVHFGLYSMVGKGEWYMHNEDVPPSEYDMLVSKFNVRKNWIKDIIKVAKNLDAKYIVLTSRHHDGFSLYDTKGLTDYDIMHTPTKRDLIKEFVDECHKENIAPFLYCTLIDWHNKDFENDFEKYLKFLFDSITLLCTNYGKIGGFWFDGTWFNKNIDWKLDELYSIIRKYQPDAIISNNGGLENQGEVINKEVDCIIFERGNPTKNKPQDKKERAQEMCQILNDHWGYYKGDNNYKSAEKLLNDYLACIKNNANFLLNIGPMENGKIRYKDKNLIKKLGKLMKNYEKMGKND